MFDLEIAGKIIKLLKCPQYIYCCCRWVRAVSPAEGDPQLVRGLPGRVRGAAEPLGALGAGQEGLQEGLGRK